MKDSAAIKRVVEGLNKDDPTLWDADGTPKLETVQILMDDETINAEDVDEAIGAFKRADSKAAAPAPQEPGAIPPFNPMNPNDPIRSQAIVEEAETNLVALRESIDEQEKAREQANDRIKELKAQADVFILAIARHKPNFTHADAVKRIQAQTIAQLEERKRTTAAVAGILAQSGNPVMPSRLDAALQMRRRTPEQIKNMAVFLHQQANARNAERQLGA